MLGHCKFVVDDRRQRKCAEEVKQCIYRYHRSLAGGILYLHEGASPRRRYFRIARRAQRARVLYDNTALKCEDDIVYIHQRAFLGYSFCATNFVITFKFYKAQV